MASEAKFEFIRAELARRRTAHQLRRLRAGEPLPGGELLLDGRRLVNFSSNDYLGLARHPLLLQRGAEFAARYGAGATASRLICGSYRCMAEVEEKLAGLKETAASLLFNSGFQANVSILPALADRHSLILADRLSHNSLIQGAVLSRAKLRRFEHNDLDHLRRLLLQGRSEGYNRVFLVTESVFSMDGDRCDLLQLCGLAQEFGAWLLVDEAHATGVLGRRGMGLTCGLPVDLVIGTFGKACGSFGAYLACSAELREYLLNCCAGFVYTTALPPATIGAIDAALELIPGLAAERSRLAELADHLRRAIHKLGWSCGDSTTQIVPLLLGGEEETLALTAWLEEHGILASAVRPPTVERGQARIRLALSAGHSWAQVENLIELLGQWRRNS